VTRWSLSLVAWAICTEAAFRIFGRGSNAAFSLGVCGLVVVVAYGGSLLKGAYVRNWRDADWRDPYAEVEALARAEDRSNG